MSFFRRAAVVLLAVLGAWVKHGSPQETQDGMIQNLWPTPLFQDVFVDKPGALSTEQLKELAEFALRLSQTLPSKISANLDGTWMSSTDIHLAQVPQYRELSEFIKRAVSHYIRSTLDEKAFPRATENEFGILINEIGLERLHIDVKELWCTISKPGDFVLPHVWPGNKLSGFVLVRPAPEGVPTAPVTLYDPRPQVFTHDWDGFMNFGSTLRINPRFGEIVIYPAWLTAGMLKQSGVPPVDKRPPLPADSSEDPLDGLTDDDITRIAYHFNVDFYLDVPNPHEQEEQSPQFHGEGGSSESPREASIQPDETSTVEEIEVEEL